MELAYREPLLVPDEEDAGQAPPMPVKSRDVLQTLLFLAWLGILSGWDIVPRHSIQ